MMQEQARDLLDRVAAVRHPCDLDLLVFFARHPRTLLSSEVLSLRLGYDLSVLADSLDVLLGAGLIARRQTMAHAARLYEFSQDDPTDGDLGSLIQMASNRDGRLQLRRALASRRDQSAGKPRSRARRLHGGAAPSRRLNIVVGNSPLKTGSGRP